LYIVNIVVMYAAHTEVTFKPADFCWSMHRIQVFCMDLYEFAEQPSCDRTSMYIKLSTINLDV